MTADFVQLSVAPNVSNLGLRLSELVRQRVSFNYQMMGLNALSQLNSVRDQVMAVVVVWWSVSSPSTPTIRVRFLLTTKIFCKKRRKYLKKRPGLAHLVKVRDLVDVSIF